MLLLAVLAGVVGVVVQLRRLAFMTDAMTHTVFPGVAIAFFMGRSLFVGALIAAAASAVLLTLLVRVGVVTTEGLRSTRRYAIVVAFIVAAVLAPPDVVSQLALAIPLPPLSKATTLTVRLLQQDRPKKTATHEY